MCLASNIASVGLVATGTVAGVLTMNPIILGTISGSGMLLKTPTEAKNFKRKIEMSKFAFTSYEKVMNEIRSFMRGKEYDNAKFLNQLKMLGDINIDMCPLTDKFESHYKKIFYWFKDPLFFVCLPFQFSSQISSIPRTFSTLARSVNLNQIKKLVCY